MFDIDWNQLFVPSKSLAELFVRGTVIYLVLFVVMRFLPRRQVGGMSASDLLVIVLIADAVQEGMAGKYESITEGLLLAATIFLWASVVDYLDYHFPQLKLAEPGPVQVVRNGQLLQGHMRRQKVTEDEVLSQIRQHGIKELKDVKAAYIEGDGHFSIIPRGDGKSRPPPRNKQAHAGGG